MYSNMLMMLCVVIVAFHTLDHFVMSNDHLKFPAKQQVYVSICLKIMSRDNGIGTDYLMLSHVNKGSCNFLFDLYHH